MHGRVYGDRSRSRRKSAIVLVSLVTSVALMSGCGSVQQALQDLSAQHPSARVTGVRLGNAGIQSLQLVFDVRIENPYSFDLPLLDLDYSLTTYGNTFLTGATALEGKVSARHARTVELPLNVDLVSMVRSIASVEAGGVVPYAAELGLRAEVPGAEPLYFPLHTSGEIPVPKAPAVQVTSLRWSETSLNKVRGVVKLDVENTNRFPFTISAVQWNLSLAETPVATGEAVRALTLEPAQVGALALDLSFSPLDLGMSLVDVLTDLNRESIDYGITGVLSVDTQFGLIHLPYARSGSTRSEPSP